jgi:hypothetical protein
VICRVAAWNKARVLAIGIVQLDRVLTPIVLRHGRPRRWSEIQVGGNGNSVYVTRQLRTNAHFQVPTVDPELLDSYNFDRVMLDFLTCRQLEKSKLAKWR